VVAAARQLDQLRLPAGTANEAGIQFDCHDVGEIFKERLTSPSATPAALW
jgi:hypothetical protein